MNRREFRNQLFNIQLWLFSETAINYRLRPDPPPLLLPPPDEDPPPELLPEELLLEGAEYDSDELLLEGAE